MMFKVHDSSDFEQPNKQHKFMLNILKGLNLVTY